MKASPFRGMDHVGMTVPDIAAATRFFDTAFDAELIYESKTDKEPPEEGADTERTLGVVPGTKVRAVRMLALRHGPGIELFEMSASDRREPPRPSDYGLQHFAVYVDDMPGAVARFESAGGSMLTGPQPFMFDAESGDGNLFCYGRTPWGATIEMVTYPTSMPYEYGTPKRRWRP